MSLPRSASESNTRMLLTALAMKNAERSKSDSPRNLISESLQKMQKNLDEIKIQKSNAKKKIRKRKELLKHHRRGDAILSSKSLCAIKAGLPARLRDLAILTTEYKAYEKVIEDTETVLKVSFKELTIKLFGTFREQEQILTSKPKPVSSLSQAAVVKEGSELLATSQESEDYASSTVVLAASPAR